MLEFIQKLKHRYQSFIRTQNGEDAADYQYRIETLMLAEAYLQKGKLIESLPKHPKQIVILGPTQAGKSSVTNLLLADNAAGVSPLAGFTVHPQGFCYAIKEQDCSWLNHYFEGFQRVSRTELIRNQYESYSLTTLNGNSSSPLPESILWDTPDFDSIDAAGYREGVLRTIALADIIILVVSKEKYADQSVWDMMSLVAPLNQPTIIIVNKLVEESHEIVLRSLEEKWQQSRNDSFPEVISLFYQNEGGLHEWPATEFNRVSRLFKTANKKSNRRNHEDNQQQLLNSHWQSWVEPIKAEHAAVKEWQSLLDENITKALEAYQRDYLDHPHHYETFQNALAELLTLLEIPGLASILVQTRKVLTWPVKQLLKLGNSNNAKKANLSDSSQEIALLNQISEHMLISLADNVLDRIDQHPETAQWWKEINSLLRQQRESILASFNDEAKLYHIDFQQEIEATAHRLYHKLEQQPLTLNSLRATRVTTDAAAVALALQAGGIGLHDLVITPAMLSVTTLLTESAIGSYMSVIEAELKQKQMQTVKQQLFNDSLKSSLINIPELMSQQAKFNIPAEQLQLLEQTLKEKRHGLRLF